MKAIYTRDFRNSALNSFITDLCFWQEVIVVHLKLHLLKTHSVSDLRYSLRFMDSEDSVPCPQETASVP